VPFVFVNKSSYFLSPHLGPPFLAQWLEWVVQLSEGWLFDSHFCHSEIGELTAGGSPPPCHKVPLSKAPCPGRCEWLPTAPVYGICLHDYGTMCMCVFNRCQPGWIKSGEEILCIYLFMKINLILILILNKAKFIHISPIHLMTVFKKSPKKNQLMGVKLFFDSLRPEHFNFIPS